MGGSGSKAPPPPAINRQPYPATPREDELSRTKSKKCNACGLSVDTSVTTANVKLSRVYGAIPPEVCARYDDDLKAYNSRFLGPVDFMQNLQNGVYSVGTSEKQNPDGSVTGYCQEVSISDEEAYKVASGAAFDATKLIRGRIRPVAGGGSFSSDTKAMYELSIPFTLRLSGIRTVLR